MLLARHPVAPKAKHLARLGGTRAVGEDQQADLREGVVDLAQLGARLQRAEVEDRDAGFERAQLVDEQLVRHVGRYEREVLIAVHQRLQAATEDVFEPRQQNRHGWPPDRHRVLPLKIIGVTSYHPSASPGVTRRSPVPGDDFPGYWTPSTRVLLGGTGPREGFEAGQK